MTKRSMLQSRLAEILTAQLVLTRAQKHLMNGNCHYRLRCGTVYFRFWDDPLPHEAVMELQMLIVQLERERKSIRRQLRVRALQARAA